jgi:2-polyprenyl-6-methoxyphenol hydroxylase-like FAD-dependent oxidoreductase
VTRSALGSSSTPYDVIIVGGRCSGASLATWLARSGVTVCVLERCGSLGDAFSTHLLQSSGVELLVDLGLGRVPAAAQAPVLESAVMHVEGIEARADLRTACGVGPVAVRRHLLDPPLLEAAAAAGADVLLHTRADGLLWADRRVRGARVTTQRRSRDIHGRLLVGADGSRSTVAALVGAGRYNVTANERFIAWGYFQLHAPAEPQITLWRQGSDLVFGYPCDSGLYVAIIQPPRDQLEGFRRNPRAHFEQVVRGHPALGAFVGRAPLAGRVRVSERHEGFFRDSAGPGWALVGDAGHFKDPALAQGMSDALRQARRLAGELVGADVDSDADRRTRAWARWRDRDAFGMYWMAVDAARAGAYSELELAMLAYVASSRDLSRRLLADVWSHRTPPHRVIGPRLIVSALGRAAREPGARGRLTAAMASRATTELSRALRFVWRRYETGVCSAVTSPASVGAGGAL